MMGHTHTSSVILKHFNCPPLSSGEFRMRHFKNEICIMDMRNVVMCHDACDFYGRGTNAQAIRKTV